MAFLSFPPLYIIPAFTPLRPVRSFPFPFPTPCCSVMFNYVMSNHVMSCRFTYTSRPLSHAMDMRWMGWMMTYMHRPIIGAIINDDTNTMLNVKKSTAWPVSALDRKWVFCESMFCCFTHECTYTYKYTRDATEVHVTVSHADTAANASQLLIDTSHKHTHAHAYITTCMHQPVQTQCICYMCTCTLHVLRAGIHTHMAFHHISSFSFV